MRKLHLPYHESDHLLTHVYKLFVGGGCVEDIANLQHSEAIALPRQTTRWEWKWFRQAFVYVAARITHHTRRAVVFLTDGHRFVEHLLVAAQRLQSFVFQ